MATSVQDDGTVDIVYTDMSTDHLFVIEGKFVVRLTEKHKAIEIIELSDRHFNTAEFVSSLSEMMALKEMKM